MTTATHRGTIDELRKLVDEMPVKASARGLSPLAAVPEPGAAHVLLEDDLVNADDFLDLARTCGARILYYDHDVFTAEAFVVLEDDDPLADGPTAEESLSPNDARLLRKLRRTATRHEGQVTTVIMCFMAEGLLHLWIARAGWHTQLAAERDLFLAEHASAQDTRVEDAHARREAERQRIAAELADDREFRAATKRGHRQDIAALAYPPPATADPGELRQHQWMVSGAARDAADLVEGAARRIYTNLEHDLDPLALEIESAGITHGATTVAARKLVLGDYLLTKTDGYVPPKHFMDRLMLRMQARRQPGRLTVAEPLPLG
ncbi:hypothetical protein ACFWNQ_10255 [Streptomyces virginiae]|uniref:hypothetical protein n=1 Tax=Streptomyces virginiae TaxID=1961 RepID=UPI00365118C1